MKAKEKVGRSIQTWLQNSRKEREELKDGTEVKRQLPTNDLQMKLWRVNHWMTEDGKGCLLPRKSVCALKLVSKELIQKEWADKAGKAQATAATFCLPTHQLLFSATINITPLSTGSPWSCCTNIDKSGTMLYWMPSYVLFHNEVYFPLFCQEYISEEIEISGSIWANSQQFWNSFLNTQVRKKWQICQDDLL